MLVDMVEGLAFTRVQLRKQCFYGVCPRIVYGGNVTGSGQFVYILSIFVPICIYSFRRCYTRFGAHPNYIEITFL
jgi:hypothetical protein